MASVFRKLVNARAVRNQRCKESQMSEFDQNTALNKERDKLLQEFLTARDELKDQYDYEKREIVTNYERRIKYLRRLIEEYDENMNMLKLNLDAEKEENFILKTKVLELENETKKRKTFSPGLHNNSYEEQSTLTYDGDSMIDNMNQVDTKDFTLDHIHSSIGGLKFSNKYESMDSIAKSSFTSITTASTSETLNISCYKFHVDDDGLHQNCRQEFNRLLGELCIQKKNFEEQLNFEREKMQEKIENEKLQLERIVYKQLNLKLDKEIKKHEYLFTENSHLRQTITQTALESIMDHSPNKRSLVSEESNSDSGADVEYNRSDDDSDTCSRKSSTELSTYSMKNINQDDSVSASIISSILYEQKSRLNSEFQKEKCREQKKFRNVIEDLNQEIVLLVKENRVLKQQTNCYENVSDFHLELTKKLHLLEDLLMVDPDAC